METRQHGPQAIADKCWPTPACAILPGGKPQVFSLIQHRCQQPGLLLASVTAPPSCRMKSHPVLPRRKMQFDPLLPVWMPWVRDNATPHREGSSRGLTHSPPERSAPNPESQFPLTGNGTSHHGWGSWPGSAPASTKQTSPPPPSAC